MVTDFFRSNFGLSFCRAQGEENCVCLSIFAFLEGVEARKRYEPAVDRGALGKVIDGGWRINSTGDGLRGPASGKIARAAESLVKCRVGYPLKDLHPRRA